MSLVDERYANELKAFIQAQLEPLSQPDPAILGDYIIALLHQDKEGSEVREFCIEQLEDFLHEHTASFVDTLLQALETKSYLPAAARPPSSVPPPAADGAYAPAPPQPASRVSGSKRRYSESSDGHGVDEQQSKRQVYSPSMHPDRANALGASNDAALPPHLAGRVPSHRPPMYPPHEGAPQPQAFQFRPVIHTPPPPPPPHLSAPGLANPDGGHVFGRLGGAGRGGRPPALPNDHMMHQPPGMASQGPRPFGHHQPPPMPPGSLHQGGYRGRPYNRGGGGGGGLNGAPRVQPSNTIVVDGIPAEKCKLPVITEFFGKFGEITNVNISPDGGRAMIQFATPDDARTAHTSPEPIFGNRFVKVYFYSPDKHAHLFNVQPLLTQAPPQTSYQSYQPRHQPYRPPADAAGRGGFNNGGAFGGGEEQGGGMSVEDVRKIMDLATRKEKTLDELMSLQKTALVSASRPGVPPAKKVEYVETAKKLEKQILSMQASLASLTSNPKVLAMAPHLREQVAEQKKKEMLDRELDLISQTLDKHDDADPVELERLKLEVKSSGALLSAPTSSATAAETPGGGPAGPTQPTFRGNGYSFSYAKFGRPSWQQTKGRYNLDLRPTKVMVKGVGKDHEGILNTHFKSFGDVTAMSFEDAGLLIQYKTRADAEKVMQSEHQILGVGTVEVSWAQ
ncbi:hypothetical protein RI367_005452 [Sorochytrium milnesiophthora]